MSQSRQGEGVVADNTSKALVDVSSNTPNLHGDTSEHFLNRQPDRKCLQAQGEHKTGNLWPCLGAEVHVEKKNQ